MFSPEDSNPAAALKDFESMYYRCRLDSARGHCSLFVLDPYAYKCIDLVSHSALMGRLRKYLLWTRIKMQYLFFTSLQYFCFWGASSQKRLRTPGQRIPTMQQYLPHCIKWGRFLDADARVTVIYLFMERTFRFETSTDLYLLA